VKAVARPAKAAMSARARSRSTRPTAAGDTADPRAEDFVRRITVACDDLLDDPCDESARAALLLELLGTTNEKGTHHDS
jgi:hypothetical protein